MRSVSLLVLVLFVCFISTSARPRHGAPPPVDDPVYIWPLPQSVNKGSTVRTLSYPFTVTSTAINPDLAGAIQRFTSTAFPHRAIGDTGNNALQSVTVSIRNLNAPLQLNTDESYSLIVPADGPQQSAVIEANTYYGALHALETLSQLIYFNFTSSTYIIPSTPWRIKDAPRYPHRGMLVDTSRHYQTLPVIRRIIDSLAFAKYNVFHWHLSDSQSFPWHVEALPRLSMAAYSTTDRYSSADIEDVVEYARQRGVRVMIEFDVPGHADSWCVGYPDVCPSPTCLSPLDPTSNATFNLLESMLNEVTGGRARSGLVTEDLIHLGGDEVDLTCWTSTPHIASWLKQNNMTSTDAYRLFVERTHDIVYAAGRTPVNWDEVWFNFGKTIDPQTIIHVWRNEEYVFNATRDGFRVLVSPDGPWYLDGLETSWQDMYELEPEAGISDAKQASLILGGESCMWGERVDASVILPTIWPRAAAVVERLWSDKGVSDVNAAEPRYAWFRCLMDLRGIEAGPYKNEAAREAPSGPGGCLMQ